MVDLTITQFLGSLAFFFIILPFWATFFLSVIVKAFYKAKLSGMKDAVFHMENNMSAEELKRLNKEDIK